MRNSNSSSQLLGCLIDVPAEFKDVQDGTEYEPAELFRLLRWKRGLDLVFGRCGLRLSEALYQKDGYVYFGVFAEVSSGSSIDSFTVREKLSFEVHRAQEYACHSKGASTPARDDAAAASQGKQKTDDEDFIKKLAAIRKTIASGPPMISIGDEDISWANALKPERPKRKQRAKFTLCRIAGSERHLIDNSDHRARAEIPAEVEDTQPGENVELLGVHSEKVILAYYDDSQPDLDFDWGEGAEE